MPLWLADERATRPHGGHVVYRFLGREKIWSPHKRSCFFWLKKIPAHPSLSQTWLTDWVSDTDVTTTWRDDPKQKNDQIFSIFPCIHGISWMIETSRLLKYIHIDKRISTHHLLLIFRNSWWETQAFIIINKSENNFLLEQTDRRSFYLVAIY